MRFVVYYITFLFSFVLLVENSFACVSVKKQVERFLQIIEVPFDRSSTHLFPEDVAVRTFEAQLAELAQVPVEASVALIRNFTADFTKDGSINVFRQQDKVYLDATVNLFDAYKWGRENIDPKTVTPDQIIEIRKRAMKIFTRAKGREIQQPEFDFKTNESLAFVGKELHPDSLKKMQEYGFEVTPTETGYTIRYGARENQIKLLTDYCLQLNQMARSQAPPEFIVSYAVQDFLIRHVFADGNGRTGRIIGQILFEKYFGKHIIFPREFHREMDYTTQDLANLIALRQ